MFLLVEVGRETYGRKIPDYTDVLSRQLIPTDKTAAEEKVRTKYLEEIGRFIRAFACGLYALET